MSLVVDAFDINTPGNVEQINDIPTFLTVHSTIEFQQGLMEPYDAGYHDV